MTRKPGTRSRSSRRALRHTGVSARGSRRKPYWKSGRRWWCSLNSSILLRITLSMNWSDCRKTKGSTFVEMRRWKLAKSGGGIREPCAWRFLFPHMLFIAWDYNYYNPRRRKWCKYLFLEQKNIFGLRFVRIKRYSFWSYLIPLCLTGVGGYFDFFGVGLLVPPDFRDGVCNFLLPRDLMTFHARLRWVWASPTPMKSLTFLMIRSGMGNVDHSIAGL